MMRGKYSPNELTYEERIGRFLKNKDVTANFDVKEKNGEYFIYQKRLGHPGRVARLNEEGLHLNPHLLGSYMTSKRTLERTAKRFDIPTRRKF